MHLILKYQSNIHFCRCNIQFARPIMHSILHSEKASIIFSRSKITLQLLFNKLVVSLCNLLIKLHFQGPLCILIFSLNFIWPVSLLLFSEKHFPRPLRSRGPGGGFSVICPSIWPVEYCEGRSPEPNSEGVWGGLGARGPQGGFTAPHRLAAKHVVRWSCVVN